jgi:amino acid transporter
MTTPPDSLKRVLSLPVLVLYGLGTTVGAGIYALIGKVAGQAGAWSPFSFLLAAGLASLTALSLCELSSRLPRAGGEAAYVDAGLRSHRLTTVVGLLVVGVGCLSAATVTRGFAGYARTLAPLPETAAILLLLAVLGGLAAWGIEEAAWAAAAMTVVEVGGLLVVIVAGGDRLAELPARWPELVPPLEAGAWITVGGTSLLCFYAFLGFEDLVNVAEEVRDVRRVLPQAILATLIATTLLYLALTIVVVLTVAPEEIATSEAPLADVYHHLTGRSLVGMGVVGVLAMTNGALIQIIKASRVLYGLADQGRLPAALRRVHPRRRTPVRATAITVGLVAALALALPIAALAEWSSLVTLGIFALAHLALCFLKIRDPSPPDVRRVPFAIPVVGGVSCAGFVLVELVGRLSVG